MRLRQLEYFIRICELGSITRAAVELNIAQPALGLQVRGLEHEFDAVLINRTARGVFPTPEGELVLSWARTVVAEAGDLRRRLKAAEARVALSIGMTASVSSLIGGSLAQAVGESLPQVMLNIVESFSHVLVDWVDEGRVDFALSFDPRRGRNMQATAVLREQLFYISAPDEGADPIPLSEVLRRPLAIASPQHSIRRVVEEAAQAVGVPVVSRSQVSSLTAARDIARRGVAGAIVPFGGIADDLRAARLSARKVVAPTLTRTLYLLRRRGRATNAVEDGFLRLVFESLIEAAKVSEGDAYDLLCDPAELIERIA